LPPLNQIQRDVTLLKKAVLGAQVGENLQAFPLALSKFELKIFAIISREEFTIDGLWFTSGSSRNDGLVNYLFKAG
jgi:hypothetical protein